MSTVKRIRSFLHRYSLDFAGLIQLSGRLPEEARHLKEGMTAVWQFDSLDEMKKFCGHIAEEFGNHGLKTWADAIYGFSYNAYTTPTEYLGELRIAFAEILSHKESLPSALIPDIKAAVQAINQAFGENG